MSSTRIPRCSVVIRCRNEELHIGRLLTGIVRQTMKDVEIIIVDSGSSDATLSIASRYPVTILHIQPEEFSFGRSLNMGCQAATAEFVAFASAHAYPIYKDWLERLLAPLTDPRVALVYGKQRGNETTKYSERRIFDKWFPNESRLQQDHPFCNNANAVIRRALWEQLPFDETLTGLEDLDWAKRAMESGLLVAYAADAEIVHVHDEAYRQIYNRYRREAIAMKRIFPQERFSLGDFIRLFAVNVVSDCRHALPDGVLRRSLGSIFRFRLLQLWGTYRGYAQRSPVTDKLRQTFYYPDAWSRTSSETTELESKRRIEYASDPTGNLVDRDH